jgi:hypothetical protein
MELGGPAALEVRDRYGEPIVMLGRLALWLGKDSPKKCGSVRIGNNPGRYAFPGM